MNSKIWNLNELKLKILVAAKMHFAVWSAAAMSFPSCYKVMQVFLPCLQILTAIPSKRLLNSKLLLNRAIFWVFQSSISNYTVIPSFDFCSLNFDWIWPSLHLNIHSIPCHRPKSKCFSHLVPTMVECWHLTSWCCDKQQKFLQSVIGFISAIIGFIS